MRESKRWWRQHQLAIELPLCPWILRTLVSVRRLVAAWIAQIVLKVYPLNHGMWLVDMEVEYKADVSVTWHSYFDSIWIILRATCKHDYLYCEAQRRTTDLYPEGATSNPAWGNNFPLSSQYPHSIGLSCLQAIYFSSKLWKRQHHQIQSILFFDSVTYPSLLSQAPFLLLFSLLENESGRNSSIKKGRSF